MSADETSRAARTNAVQSRFADDRTMHSRPTARPDRAENGRRNAGSPAVPPADYQPRSPKPYPLPPLAFSTAIPTERATNPMPRLDARYAMTFNTSSPPLDY
jgi:hypothetical protein